MKDLGTVRKIDELGRIVIPKEVRDAQGWESGHSMEMFMDENKLVLQSYEDERKRNKAINNLEKILENSLDSSDEQKLENAINYLKGRKSYE